MDETDSQAREVSDLSLNFCFQIHSLQRIILHAFLSSADFLMMTFSK